VVSIVATPSLGELLLCDPKGLETIHEEERTEWNARSRRVRLETSGGTDGDGDRDATGSDPSRSDTLFDGGGGSGGGDGGGGSGGSGDGLSLGSDRQLSAARLVSSSNGGGDRSEGSGGGSPLDSDRQLSSSQPISGGDGGRGGEGVTKRSNRTVTGSTAVAAAALTIGSVSAAATLRHCQPVAAGDVLPRASQAPGAWLVFRPSRVPWRSVSGAGGGGGASVHYEQTVWGEAGDSDGNGGEGDGEVGGGRGSADDEVGKEEGVLCTRFALEVTHDGSGGGGGSGGGRGGAGSSSHFVEVTTWRDDDSGVAAAATAVAGGTGAEATVGAVGTEEEATGKPHAAAAAAAALALRKACRRWRYQAGAAVLRTGPRAAPRHPLPSDALARTRARDRRSHTAIPDVAVSALLPLVGCSVWGGLGSLGGLRFRVQGLEGGV